MFGTPDEVEERHAPGHEQKLIEEACEEFIRDPDSNRFPLNLREEVGDGTLLLAARTIYQLRTAREKQRLRLDSWQESLESAEHDRRRFRLQTGALGVERDEARQERDKFRNEWHTVGRQLRSALRERNRLRKKNDALTSTLSELQQEHQDLQERLKDTEREPARLRDENKALTCQLSELQQAHHYSQERLENTEQESARLREKNDALTSQLFEPQQEHQDLQERLEGKEQEPARLRDEKDALARRLSESEELLASEGLSASVERKLRAQERLVKRLEQKGRGDAREHKRLGRKLDDADARHKRELRKRDLFIGILANIVVVLFIAIVNPDIMDQGRQLLFTFMPDDAAPATAPFSSPVPIMVTQRQTTRPTVTQTPRPTVTPRPTSTSAPTHTPSSTAPQQFVVLEALGANARACPRMNCEVLTKLARDSQVVVMDEVQGEVYRDSALWYRVALPDGPDDAYVHSSLLGTPDG